MSKKTQGFSSTGSRGIAPKSGPSYSRDELAALSKINPESNPYGIDGTHTSLCDMCGRPIASQSPFEKPNDRFSFFEQNRARVHFACASHRSRIEAEKQRLAEVEAKRQYDLLPEDEKARLEDEEAKRFNADDTPTAKVYRPKPGELSLDRVKAVGGVSKALAPELPSTFTYAQEEDPKIIAQTKAREEAIRQQFLADMEKHSPE